MSDRLVDLGIGGPGTFDERGLLGVAFHPDFANNGLLYTYTSEPADSEADFSTMPEGVAADHQTVITEWTVSDPTNPNATVDSNSDRVIMRIDQPQFNHNAGALNFGPDGFLYIALGDGGGRDDQGVGHSEGGNGQDPTNVLGSLLRIDPLGDNSDNGEYGIPEDNPFVDYEEIPDETFAFGFRNPFRFSFDRETGDLVLGDVGQDDLEEINIVEAGGNFGWSLKEGTFFFNANGEEPGFVTDVDPGVPEDLIDPVLQYDHDEGLSAIGGFVYRGENNPELTGQFVFGDYSKGFSNPQGRLLLGNLSTGEIEDITPEDFPFFILGFAEDNDGEVYVLANETGVPFEDTGVIFQLKTLGINGTAGKDKLTGTANDDRINGKDGNDILRGLAGDDTLKGGRGKDQLNGGKGADLLRGGAGNDILRGGAGNDKLIGDRGNDILNGGRGTDTLIGGKGADILIGGKNNDILTGNSGTDQFVFNSLREGVEEITDFRSGVDKIVFSADRFGGGLTLRKHILKSQFKLGRVATRASHRFIYNQNNGRLFFDEDGTGPIGKIHIATLNIQHRYIAKIFHWIENDIVKFSASIYEIFCQGNCLYHFLGSNINNTDSIINIVNHPKLFFVRICPRMENSLVHFY